MGFEIAPGDPPEEWRFDGEDWVKPDEDGIPWVWDGEEYGIKDGETGRTMVERDDGIYLKDQDGRLIASENPKTGEWQYFEESGPADNAKQSRGSKPLTSGNNGLVSSDSMRNLQPPFNELKSSMSSESFQATTVAPSSPASPPPAAPQAASPPPVDKNHNSQPTGTTTMDLEHFVRRFWCRDDNSVEIRGFRKNPQCLNYTTAMVEHLRQIQYICKRILRANHQAGGVTTPADQVLCAIAITIVDLFDPASAESTDDSSAERALKHSLAKLLQSNDLQIFEPMKSRAMCLLKNRLQCCLHQ